MNKKQIKSFLLAIILFFLTLVFVDFGKQNENATYVLAVTVFMAVMWITEAIPLGVTALFPVVLFPVFGILSAKQTAVSYVNDVIFLFMGGFMIALSMEKWNLHRRIALFILMKVGSKPNNILIGFMLATAFLSMWISNTATAMMLLPIAISIISEFEKKMPANLLKKFSIALMLAIAYSASIGGIATLVGTAPNLVLIKTLDISFSNIDEISFGNWFLFAFPLSMAMLFFAWLLLYILYLRTLHGQKNLSSTYLKDEYSKLGKLSYEEKIMLYSFVAFALLLIFRSDLKTDFVNIQGWSNLLPEKSFVKDGTISIAVALLLFLIPAKNKNEAILDWNTAKKLPWDIIILFGGGFALAKAFAESGLSVEIGESLKNIVFADTYINVLIISFIVVFLTEVTSNTATTQILLPIIGGVALATDINPLLYMLPATISASMAFMLPVATPPNAIVFGSGKIKIKDMAKTGFALNLLAILIILVFVKFFSGSLL